MLEKMDYSNVIRRSYSRTKNTRTTDKLVIEEPTPFMNTGNTNFEFATVGGGKLSRSPSGHHRRVSSQYADMTPNR